MWSTSLENFTDCLIGGVDHTLAGNGGPECTSFLSSQRRSLETLGATALATMHMVYGYCTLNVPPVPKVERQDRGGKRALLVLMCLIFGMEIGFKFSSKTLIYILNPCHVVTVIQIFLLAAPPTNRIVTALFRIQMHCLNGPILALLFPVLNTRLLPMEMELYWLQHVLMLVIPFYLLRTGITGVYTVEPLAEYSWAFLTLGLQFLYHFWLLQGLALLTEVNLNSMGCPAVSDPFYGDNYRIWALTHQSLMILVVGKLYTAVSLWVLKALGTVVWTGEKYAALATMRMQQLCSMCRGACPTLKREDDKRD